MRQSPVTDWGVSMNAIGSLANNDWPSVLELRMLMPQ